jgi:parallel beta-helix repeat protein
LIENNLVYRAQDGGFHQNYGRNNTVRNNIFSFGRTAEIVRSAQKGEEDHYSFTLEHNLVYWQEGLLFSGKWDKGHYQFENNLYFLVGGAPIQFGKWSSEEWQKRGQDTHSIVEDPLFVDAKHDDFRLKPGSPALKVGFQPFEIGDVGPRKDRGR